jgi:hypothetical protein
MENSALDEVIATHKISQILLRYCTAIDTQRPELMADCFTTDAVLRFAFMADFTPATYIAMCKTSLATFDSTQHLIGPPLVKISGNTASSRCYFTAQHVMNALAPNPCLNVGGWYDDQLVRVGDDWKIQQRQGVTLWVDGNPAVLGNSFPVGAPQKSPLFAPPSWMEKPNSN